MKTTTQKVNSNNREYTVTFSNEGIAVSYEGYMSWLAYQMIIGKNVFSVPGANKYLTYRGIDPLANALCYTFSQQPVNNLPILRKIFKREMTEAEKEQFIQQLLESIPNWDKD